MAWEERRVALHAISHLVALIWNVAAMMIFRYKASTWNFYLFPRPYAWQDRRFTCQAASLQFLTEHKFDFNKFIYEVR